VITQPARDGGIMVCSIALNPGSQIKAVSRASSTAGRERPRENRRIDYILEKRTSIPNLKSGGIGRPYGNW
jgi:hypothetical protein